MKMSWLLACVCIELASSTTFLTTIPTTPDPPTTVQAPATPQTTTHRTTTPTTPPYPGCVYNGVTYEPWANIESGQDGNWCWEIICGENGEIIYGDDFYCGTTTTPVPVTSTSTTRRTTTPSFPPYPGCVYNGATYEYWETIDWGRIEGGNMCWVQVCGENGEILHGTDYCDPTTTTRVTTIPTTPGPPTTVQAPLTSPSTTRRTTFETTATTSPPTTVQAPATSPSTTRRTTTPSFPPYPGCVYNGVTYEYWDTIDWGRIDGGNMCWIQVCGENGEILHGTDYCDTTTTSTTFETTASPSTTTTLIADTCEDLFMPDTQDYLDCLGITRSTTISSPTTVQAPITRRTTFETTARPPTTTTRPTTTARRPTADTCEDIFTPGTQDYFDCLGITRPTTIPPLTTAPLTTTTTTPFADTCEDLFLPDTQDYFNCLGITRPTTTGPSTPPSTLPQSCFSGGQFYPLGSEISSTQDVNHCHGLYCDEYGQVLEWHNFNCDSLTTPSPPGSTPRGGITTLPICPLDPPVLTNTVRTQPAIEDSEQVVDGYIYEELVFHCVMNGINANLFYDIAWYVDGKEIRPTFKSVAGSALASAALRERHWVNGFQLGIKVKCSMAASYDAACPRGERVFSPESYAGIKASVMAITVTEGVSPVTIQYQSTVPIACRHRPGQPSEPCSLRLDPNGVLPATVCPSPTEHSGVDGDLTFSCGFEITSDKWNELKVLRITGVYKKTYGDRNSRVDLSVVSRWPVTVPRNIWRNIIVPSVMVTIQDIDRPDANKKCTVTSDPNFRTFDGQYYNNRYTGEFVLHRHKTRPYSVNIMQERCRLARSQSCVCGIAVQSGNDVFVLAGCGTSGYYRTRRYGCNSEAFDITSANSGGGYDIKLPSGSRLGITINRYDYLMVYIHPTATDYGMVGGLCGTLDDNISNDYAQPDGKTVDLTKFLTSWRVQPADSLYNGTITHAQQLGPDYCSCARALDDVTGFLVDQTTCSKVPPYSECRLPGSGPDQTSSYSSACRRKRDTYVLDMSDDDWPPFEYDVHYVPQEPTWRNGWDETKARDFCVNYLTTSNVYQGCIRIPNVDMKFAKFVCVQDMLLSGGTEWVRVALNVYREDCQDEVLRNSTLWVAQNEPSVLGGLVNALCPDDCSGHGNCVEAVCQCHQGFDGHDCSVNTTGSPSRLAISRGGHCDVTKRPCRAVRVYGHGFLKSAQLSCRIRQIQIDSTGIFSYKPSEDQTAIFLNRREVICPLPEGGMEIDDNSTLVSLSGYKVSVSNTGAQFRDWRIVVPYNPTCFSCDIQRDEAMCSIKDGYCFIDGSCVETGKSVEGSPCSVCDPRNSTTSWTEREGFEIMEPSGLVCSSTNSLTASAFLLILCLYVVSLWNSG